MAIVGRWDELYSAFAKIEPSTLSAADRQVVAEAFFKGCRSVQALDRVMAFTLGSRGSEFGATSDGLMCLADAAERLEQFDVFEQTLRAGLERFRHTTFPIRLSRWLAPRKPEEAEAVLARLPASYRANPNVIEIRKEIARARDRMQRLAPPRATALLHSDEEERLARAVEEALRQDLTTSQKEPLRHFGRSPFRHDPTGTRELLAQQKGSLRLVLIYEANRPSSAEAYAQVNRLAQQFAARGLATIGLVIDDSEKVVEQFADELRDPLYFPSYRVRRNERAVLEKQLRMLGVHPPCGRAPHVALLSASGRVIEQGATSHLPRFRFLIESALRPSN